MPDEEAIVVILRPSEASQPPAGTRFKAGRRPAAEASKHNIKNVKIKCDIMGFE